jgi:hypothetical protein
MVTIERDANNPYQGRPIAFMRVVRPNPEDESTMSLDDAAPKIGMTVDEIKAIHGIDDLHKCWDLATMGVIKEYQGTITSSEALTILNRMFVRLAGSEDIDHMLAIIDNKALRGLRIIGTPLVPMGDPEARFDADHAFSFDSSSKSFAVYGHVPSYMPSFANRYAELTQPPQSDTSGMREYLRQAVGGILIGNEVDPHIVLPQGV